MRRASPRRRAILWRLLTLLVSWENNEDLRQSLIERAFLLAKRYGGRPKSLAQLAIASLIAASRELNIPLDATSLLHRARDLGYKGIRLSSVLKMAHELGYQESLITYHRDQTRRLIVKLCSSLTCLDSETKVELLKKALRESSRTCLTGLRPSTRALLAFLLALRHLGLNLSLRAYELAEASNLSDITVYRAMKKVALLQSAS